jgi:glycosyltransferase involved in cell wall biosynthesis
MLGVTFRENYTESEITISVFTATFNRRSTLPRVFNSLQNQTMKEFEWIIVDDGSTDKTEELIKNYVSVADFPITYFWQENRGKHTAFNKFAELASGRYYCQLDSDDELLPQCLERMLFHINQIPSEEEKYYAGVMCLAQSQDGLLIGEKFEDLDFGDDLARVILRHKRLGDKGALTKLSVLQGHPFPEDHIKIYLPETYHILDYSRKFKTKFINEVLIQPWTEPRDDHLSHTLVKKENFYGYRYGLLCWIKFAPNLLWEFPVKYIRYSIKLAELSSHLNISFSDQISQVEHPLSKFIILLGYPFGSILALLRKYLLGS